MERCISTPGWTNRGDSYIISEPVLHSGVKKKQLSPEMRAYLNYFIALCSLALSVVAIEVGLRVFSYISQSNEFEKLIAERPQPTREQACTLGDIIQISNDPDIVFELRPDLNTRFLEVPLRTNSHGFRSPEISMAREEGEFRILGLGDSVMFGWGVPARSSYLNRARVKLARHFPGCDVKMINTAVPGYNGVMEAATLKRKGLQFSPDIVVLGVVQNDLDLPNFIQSRDDYLSLGSLFIVSAFFNRTSKLRLVAAPTDDTGDGFAGNPAKISPPYRHLVGQRSYINALRSMQSSLQVNSIPLLTLSHHSLSSDLDEIFTTLGIPVLEGLVAWNRFANQNYIHDPDAAAQLVPGKDPHPSALLHRVLGELLYQNILKDRRMIDRLRDCSFPGSKKHHTD